MSRFRAGWLTLVAVLITTSASAQQPDAKVEVAKAIVKDLPASAVFVGTVTPARRAVLGSAVDGRLVEIVEDGLWVRKGEPVARLRTGTINIEIAGAQAELALRENESKEMQAGLRTEEVEMAAAKLASADALAQYTKSRYERTRNLRDKGQATSQEEVEQALSAWIAADRAKAGAEAEHVLAVKGHRDEKKDQALDRVAMQKEIVNGLRDRRNKYWVRTYFNGYVVTQHAEVGAWIRQGDPLVEVIELDPVEITVNVPEHHIDQVQIGVPAQVRIDAIRARDAWTGEVASINPQADLRSRTFAVKVRLANEEVPLEVAKATAAAERANQNENVDTDEEPAEPAPPARGTDVEPSELKDTPDDTHIAAGELKQHRFKAGMLAHVRLPLGERKKAILVPKDALVLGGSAVDGQPTYTVFVAAPSPMGAGHVAQPVSVAIGLYDGDWVEVVPRTPGALAAGTLVVTLGNERLRPMQGISFGK